MQSKLILIPVTQDHIDQGVRGNQDKCPIALACNDNKDLFNLSDEDKGKFYITPFAIKRHKSCIKYKLELQAKAFVNQFDKYGAKKVEPFVFEVDLNKFKTW